MPDIRNNRRLVFLAFATYFVTGAACMVVGTFLPELVKFYDAPIEKVVLLGTVFALGRICTVPLTGKLAEKLPPLRILCFGAVFMTLYLAATPFVRSMAAGYVFAALGGAGMGIQDTVCPMILAQVYPDRYSSMLSVGQAFFGIGCFSLSLLMSGVLAAGLDYRYTNVIIAALALVIVAVIPFTYLERKGTSDGEESVPPIKVRNMPLAIAVSGITAFLYCCAVSMIGLYTSSYAELSGMDASQAALILTLYNVGGCLGDFLFAAVLRKAKETDVLILNTAVSLIASVLLIKQRSAGICGTSVLVMGLMLGVLYSVILAVFTRIGYEHMGVAGSLMAFCSGAGDCLAPAVSGKIVGELSVSVTFAMVAVTLAAMTVSSVILKLMTKEKE